jgi:hypothetical protein
MKSVLLIMFLINRAAHALIIGGVDMTAHDPIQRSTAAIYEPSSNGVGGALCTASLIGKNTALTAAHCVQKGAYSPVMIFGPNVRSPDSVHLPVTGVAVNPDWQKKRGRGMDQGDIAVVKFDGKLPPGYHAATLDSAKNEIKKGDTAILAGYGISNAKTHEGAGLLRKTSVSVDSPRKGKSEMIFNQSRGHGACHGDSGGPAYFKRGRKMILGGVTNRSYPNSASDDCAHKVVYTKVSAYRPWIEKSEDELNSKNQKQISSPSLARNDASNKVANLKRQLTKKMSSKAIKPYLVKKYKNKGLQKTRHQLARHQHARRVVAKQKTIVLR